MKAIIIEDEHLAAQALEKLVGEVFPELRVTAVLQSIDESVEWLGTHPMPDLVFMDIHLADGSSFSIFDEIKIDCPIIFTTAYDEYALKAFEVNSVDYLLKPIAKPELERAIGKFKAFSKNNSPAADNSAVIENLMASLKQGAQVYKSSLLVCVKDKLTPIAVKDIAYIYIGTGIVNAVLLDGTSYVLDINLDQIAKQLNPDAFYRANRQYIIARTAVKDMSLWFGNKLAVNLKISTPERIYISRANVREFKNWITGQGPQ